MIYQNKIVSGEPLLRENVKEKWDWQNCVGINTWHSSMTFVSCIFLPNTLWPQGQGHLPVEHFRPVQPSLHWHMDEFETQQVSVGEEHSHTSAGFKDIKKYQNLINEASYVLATIVQITRCYIYLCIFLWEIHFHHDKCGCDKANICRNHTGSCS